MGPSGSGKSSLLAYIAGSLSADLTGSGSVTLNGIELTSCLPHKRRVGVLFKDDFLFPHMSVRHNLSFALPRKYPIKKRNEIIETGLSEVGLEGFENRDPATLSGGQRARVSLLRTLLAEPQALLLDEPFSKLNSELRSQIRSLVFSRAQAAKLPTVLVTHDPIDAAEAGGEVIRIKSGHKWLEH